MITLRIQARKLVARMGATLNRRPGPRILMYHRICHSNHRLAVTPELFQSHLDLLEKEGYEVLSIASLLERIAEPNLHAVALSFDDGYAEMATEVVPLLLDRGFGATFFVLPRFANTPRVISPEANFPDGGASFLSLSQIRSIHDSGFEIGAHSLTHATLTELPDWLARIELRDSAIELEELLQASVAGFAYPRGMYNVNHNHLAKSVGFQYAVSVRPGPVEPNTGRFDLTRTEVAGSDTSAMLLDKLNGGLDGWHDSLQMARNFLRTKSFRLSEAT